MTRCRRTDAIADIVADPGAGPDALTEEQQRHVATCADCHAAVAGLDELDAALTNGLAGFRHEDLPLSVLATPPLPRRDASGPATMTFVTAAAAVVLALVVAVGGYRWLEFGEFGLGPSETDGSFGGTPTPATSPVPTPAPSASAEVPAPADLEVGNVAAVVNEDLVIRTAPGVGPDSTITEDRLWIGQRVRLLAGPVEADGYRWWEVQVGEIRGWVADADRADTAPWLSPIGNGRIAVTLYPENGGEPQLFTMQANGSDLQPLFEPLAAAARLVLGCVADIGPARWSHDGGWMTFDYTVDGCGRAVAVVRADGTDLRVLGDGNTPAWRPDGGAVTFGQNVDYQLCLSDCGGDAEEGPWELMIAEMDGTAPTPLTRGGAWFSAANPAWAPNRSMVAFSGYTTPDDGLAPAGASHVYLVDGAGENPRQIAVGRRPTWSPDGRWIVFEAIDPETGLETLHRIRPDGSDEQPIGNGTHATFSPDGSRLAAVRDDGVWTMAPDGTDASLVFASVSSLGHAWAPDGTSLVVSGLGPSGTVDLSVVNVDGGAPVVIHLGVGGAPPTWQPLLLDPRLGD